MIWILAGVLWFACGLLSWGFYHGSHKHADYGWLPPRTTEQIFFSLCGPIELLATGLTYGTEHWSWRPSSIEERWSVWVSRGYGESPEDRQEFEEKWGNK